MNRPWSWYAREIASLAAISAFCWLVVQIADRLQPGAFPQ